MADVVLLDGGLGEELIARSGGAAGPLWSTRVMIDRPGLVRALHADYFAAGARVATTNTYAIHRDRLAAAGLEDLVVACLERGGPGLELEAEWATVGSGPAACGLPPGA